MRRAVWLTAAVVAFATLTSAALAQIDAQSQALLDGLRDRLPAEQQELQTVDQTMVITSTIGGTDTVATNRTVIDFVNRRAVIFTDIGGGMVVRMVHVDGVTTMHMPGMPMALPVPGEMAGAFDSIFDAPQAYTDDPNARAVYDGDVSYGDVVSGRQVTYTTTHDVDGTASESTSRLIFDAAGEYIASVIDGTDGADIIIVFGPASEGQAYMYRDSTMYEFKDGVGTVTATTKYESVAINEPLDEALFE